MCVMTATFMALSVATTPAGPRPDGSLDRQRQGACPLASLSTIQTYSLQPRPIGETLPPRPTAYTSTALANLEPSGSTGPAEGAKPSQPASISPWLLDAHIRRYATLYQVDYLLVAAIVRHESNWKPSAVSSRGAIGLMQLMPTTAAMLGVDPTDPIENLRGGIAYLAGLLKTYKDVRIALIAYNAGPEHANKVVRGEVGLYPETQKYLETINAVYTLPGER